MHDQIFVRVSNMHAHSERQSDKSSDILTADSHSSGELANIQKSALSFLLEDATVLNRRIVLSKVMKFCLLKLKIMLEKCVAQWVVHH